MSTNYTPQTGTIQTAQAPSPAPSPGNAPILALPVDADSRNAASVYEPFKASGDMIADTRKVLQTRIPIAATSGFSAVTHVGAGLGTVTPSSGPTNGGYNFVVLTTLAGNVGVAKFKVSIDGGATFGAEQTTAATYTEPTSTVVIAFSSGPGAFALNDTYAFRQTDTPQLILVDSAGSARDIHDHNGYPLGRLGRIYENWCTLSSVGGVSGTPVAGTVFTPLLGGAGSTATFGAGNSSYNSPYANLLITTTAGAFSQLYTNTQLIHAGATNMTAVLEFDAGISAIPSGTYNAYLGFSDNKDQTIAGNVARFVLTASAGVPGNWICATNNGGGGTTFTSSVAAVAATEPNQRFRIELHSAGSPFGACARFFINAQYVTTITGTFPATNLFASFCMYSSPGAPSNISLRLGGVSLVWNRFASLDLL